MANRNEDSKRVPWLPVHDDGRQREPIAPSKPAVPAVPARHSSMFSPEPVEVEDSDSDIIAPVDAPPPEEIMPTNSRVTWDAVPVFTPPTPTAGAAAADPIRSLGDAAVTRASLSASGAPTPLGGVAPSAPSTHPSAPEPAATPPSGAATAAPAPAPAPGFMATTPPAGAGTPPRSPLQDLEDDTPPFTPLFGTPTVDRAGAGVIGGDEPPVAEKQRTPWWRSWPALVIIGLLVMGAVAYAIVMALPADEAVELTPEVIVATPDEPTHEPISIENPTPFQEALPPLVGLYALTGHESADLDNLELPVRVAEGDLLTYEYQDEVLAVSAFQHYDVESAIAQFDDIAIDGSDRAPVSAGDTDVGERVTITDGDSVTIVWRNSTAIFSVTGPADAAESFFANSPL